MRFDVVTLFPDLVSGVRDHGIVARAVREGLVSIRTWNPRDYALGNHRSVDDRPYGGGPGMVMLVEPLRRCLAAVREAAPATPVIYMSPQGRPVTQESLVAAAGSPGMVLLAGRYEGIDERLLETEVDEEWSIGDYVLSGGEIPAMVVIDGITRLLPGALGADESADLDSFMNGLLDYPQYTRPADVDGMKVPEVLLSGDHEAIRRWRRRQALRRTRLRRPDLLEGRRLSAEEMEMLASMEPEDGKS